MKGQIYYLLTIMLMLSVVYGKSQEDMTQSILFQTEYKFNYEIERELARSVDSWKHQVSASDYASKGDHKNALIQWDVAMGAKESDYAKAQIDSINEQYSVIPAKDYIVKQARISQVLIINEAHHNSFHRVFTKSLLKELYDAGYKNLGLEALDYADDIDSLQHIRKYPIQKTGYYVKDPQFGNLIREAIAIGYTIFPYETKDKEANGGPREIDQAKNIQKFMEKRPDEKFLIHCGFDHVLEGDHQSWGKAMAGRLEEYTGINPLTINQVVYSEKSDPKFNHPLLKAVEVIESSILLDKNDAPLKYQRGDSWSDIAVFHPNTTYYYNRPDWLFENDIEKVTINYNDLAIEFPVLVLAFKKGEDINVAVPIDITEIEDKNDTCILGLKKGIYEIVITNKKKAFKFDKEIK